MTYAQTFLFAAVAFMISGCHADPAAEADAEARTGWSYEEREDPMAAEKEYVATVYSSNRIQVPPFSDPLRGKLYLWSDPRRGDVVRVDIGEGVLMRCVGGCEILVRFDDDAAIQVSANRVGKNFGTIQFSDYDGFTQKMLRAKRVNIELEIGYEGAFVFSFDVSGFDVNRYAPELKNRKDGEATNLKNRTDGELFLATNGSDPQVITTASGLQYTIVRPGYGLKPEGNDRVRLHYKLQLLDGAVMDSSYARGVPAEFEINQVVPGWSEGLKLMQAGSVFILWVPANLAYGDSSAGPIPPGSTLKFEIELLEVIKANEL